MEQEKMISGVFLTFTGNCKAAMLFYQSCFGGEIYFKYFDENLFETKQKPIILGSLISKNITIHGSDLVHSEGRKIGNYISIYFQCENRGDRKSILNKLQCVQQHSLAESTKDHAIIEVVDPFEVRWMLGCK